jgi:hypothetical protein
MLVDRLELLNAIAFIYPVIAENDNTGKNCLFVRVDKDEITLTGGGMFTSKKVVITRPGVTDELADEIDNPIDEKTFMIPKGTLHGFAELMKSHKKKAKKLARSDESYLYVEIDEKQLKSFEVFLTFPQPEFDFQNLESLFEIEESEVSRMPVYSADISAIMSGFARSEHVHIVFSGDNGRIHFSQEKTGYEAILIPPIPSEGSDTSQEENTDSSQEEDAE